MRAAASFLTRLRFGGHASTSTELARGVPWFPLVGLAIGGLVAAVYIAALLLWPPLVAAALAVGSHALVTGALHEDGLADVADAFGGNWGKERALAVLKDPTHGTYGVLALTIAVLVRVASIALLDARHAVAVLPVTHALSRAAAVGLMGAVPAAAERGSGAAHAAHLTRQQVGVAAASAVVVALLLMGPWALAAAAAGGAGAMAVGSISKRKIGGITGDVLGATQQLAEVAILLVVGALVVRGRLALWWE